MVDADHGAVCDGAVLEFDCNGLAAKLDEETYELHERRRCISFLWAWVWV